MADPAAPHAPNAAVVQAINNATTAFQQLTQSVQALPGQIANAMPQPVQQPPVVFNRSPLGAGPANQIINYETKEGRKFHERATRSLFPQGELYGIEPSEFKTLMTRLAERAKDLGFTVIGGLCMIPPDPQHPLQGPHLNSVEDYGRTTLDQIRAWEETFLGANAGQQGRLAQDSKILYDLLMASLSSQGLARIDIWKHQYVIMVGGEPRESGGCLLKVIVRESYLDSTATTSAIRLQLSTLDDYIHENGTDLIAFNTHVRQLMDGLAARGTHSTPMEWNRMVLVQ